MMATLGQESARPPLSKLGSSPTIQAHIGSGNLPSNRGLERALEEAAASGVLNLSSRKLKEFPRTGIYRDLTDTVEAGRRLSGISARLANKYRLGAHRCCAVTLTTLGNALQSHGYIHTGHSTLFTVLAFPLFRELINQECVC